MFKAIIMKKNVLIVGSSSSLGKEVFKKLNKKNYNVIQTSNNKNIYSSLKCNFVNYDSIEESIKKIKLLKINFHYIFFFQGQLVGKSLYNYKNKEIIENLNINFLSCVQIIKNVKLSKNSLAIFVSSVSGQRGSYDPIYAAGKSALINLTKSLSSWHAPRNRFICICPGPVKDTPMFNEFSSKRKRYHRISNPNKELLNSKDLASIILNLMEPHWRHANGSIININGGVYS
jgi:NAD(P)-dependent dehydrogenase (short-subunit alcohol dehydrogenase family)